MLVTNRDKVVGPHIIISSIKQDESNTIQQAQLKKVVQALRQGLQPKKNLELKQNERSFQLINILRTSGMPLRKDLIKKSGELSMSRILTRDFIS